MTTQRPDRPGGDLLDRRALTDPTRCPACAVPLPGPVCGACGLDTSGPTGLELWNASQEVLAVLERRDALIARIRAGDADRRRFSGASVPGLPGPAAVTPATASTATATVTAPAAAGTRAVPAFPAPVVGPRPDAAAARPGLVPDPAIGNRFPGPPAAPVLPPRRSWPLQNVLLALGAVLVGGSSIVFLAFAWGAMPLAVRALITVGLTVLFFALASASARRQLTASAEALAAVGSLLVVLDVWALRATGLLDLPRGQWYLAVVAAVSAAVLVPLGRRWGFVVPRAIGTLLVPAAPALLAFSLPAPGARGPLLAVAVATCVIALDERCEPRVAPALRGGAIALAVLCAATSLAALFADGPLEAAGSLAAAAAACVLWAWRSDDGTTAAGGWSGAAGTGVALSAAALASGLVRALDVIGWDDLLSPHFVWAAPLGATVGALAVGHVVPRVPRVGASARTAATTTLVVLAGLPVLTAMSLLATAALVPSVPSDPAALVVVATLAGLLVATAGLVVVDRVRPTRTTTRQVAALSGALAVLTVGLLPGSPVWHAVVWLVVPLALVLTLDGRLPHDGRAGGPWLTALRATTCAGAALTVVLGAVLASGATSAVPTRTGEIVLAAALLCAAVVLVLARGWTRTAPDAGTAEHVHVTTLLLHTLLLGAVVLGATGFGTAVQAVVDVRSIGWFVAALVVVLPVAGLAVAGRRAPAAPPAEHGVLLLAATLVATPALVVGSLEPLAAGSRADTPVWLVALAVIVAASALLVAGVVSTGPGRGRAGTGPDGAEPDAAGPDPAGAVRAGSADAGSAGAEPSAADRSGPTHRGAVSLRTTAAALVPVLVVLVALALRPLDREGRVDWTLLCASVVALLPALASALPRPPAAPRRAMELSATVVGLLAVLTLAATGGPQPLLVALLVQAAGALAWAVTPGRGRAGWLALGLAVVASWVALADGQVDHPEAYTAPGAVVVLVVGLWRLVRGRPAAAAPLLGGVGALLLPTSLLAPTAGGWRPLALVATVLVIAVVVTLAHPGRAGAQGPAAATGPAAGLPGRPVDGPPITSSLAVLALAAATVGVWGRALILALESTGLPRRAGAEVPRDGSSSLPTSADVLVWVAVATVLVAALCVALGRSWAWHPSRGPRVWAPTLVAGVLTAPLAILADDQGAGVLALALVVVWGAAAVLGTPPGLPRVASRTEFVHRAAPPLVGALVTALVLGGTSVPADLLLVVAGGFVTGSTVRFAIVEPRTSSWRSLTYGVLATTSPLTVAMLVDPAGWRIALGLVVAAGWVLAGVRLGWQAPVALGGAALSVQVLALAGPPALAALAGVPGWLVLAAVGGVLLLLGLTYERQIRTARASARWYSELR